MTQSRKQQAIVARVMHEFKRGELPLGKDGVVRNPRQAIAIALSEAGASDRVPPRKNRQRLARTMQGETRAELLRQAQDAGIPGRSRMRKDELQRALARR